MKSLHLRAPPAVHPHSPPAVAAAKATLPLRTTRAAQLWMSWTVPLVALLRSAAIVGVEARFAPDASVTVPDARASRLTPWKRSFMAKPAPRWWLLSMNVVDGPKPCHVTLMVAVKTWAPVIGSNMGAVPATLAVVSLEPNCAEPVKSGAPELGSILEAPLIIAPVHGLNVTIETNTSCAAARPGDVKDSNAVIEASVPTQFVISTLPKSASAWWLWNVHTGVEDEKHPPPPVPLPCAVPADRFAISSSSVAISATLPTAARPRSNLTRLRAVSGDVLLDALRSCSDMTRFFRVCETRCRRSSLSARMRPVRDVWRPSLARRFSAQPNAQRERYPVINSPPPTPGPLPHIHAPCRVGAHVRRKQHAARHGFSLAALDILHPTHSVHCPPARRVDIIAQSSRTAPVKRRAYSPPPPSSASISPRQASGSSAHRR